MVTTQNASTPASLRAAAVRSRERGPHSHAALALRARHIRIAAAFEADLVCTPKLGGGVPGAMHLAEPIRPSPNIPQPRPGGSCPACVHDCSPRRSSARRMGTRCEAARQGAQRPSVYFKVLRHLESCLAALWQGIDLKRRALETDVFAKGDGSVFERLNWLYNKGRHYQPQAPLPAGDLHALWLTNDGLHSRKHAVTFEEMREAEFAYSPNVWLGVSTLSRSRRCAKS